MLLAPHVHHRPSMQDIHRRFVRKMQKRLDLTPQQTQAFDAISTELMHRFEALHQQIQPQVAQIRHEEGAKFRAVLNPEQQKKFDAWVARQEARHHHPPPPPAGH